MTEMFSSVQKGALVRRSNREDESGLDSSLVPYDENLLERSRTQWQFGDWSSLCRLSREMLQHHPDRAKLALIAAAGHFQLGNSAEARKFVRLARDWGCGNKIISSIIIAGVHNCIGRAAAIDKNKYCALRHFENALNIGTPGCDANLLTTARFKEQRSQIQARRLDILDLNKYKLSKYNHIKIENNSSHIDAVLFFSEKEGDRKKSIDLLHSAMVSSFPSDNIPSINWTAIEFESKHFYFLHFDNDYIPKKIADTGKFYEQHFLIMLGRLHHPGRLVVDCGANIGNHTIYFSGVLKASVVSFEPQPYNRFFLDANRVLNGLEELIYVKNVALGRAKGCVELQMAIDGNYGSFTSDMRNIEKVREVEASCDKYTVNVSTIDDELASCKSSISIIKIDVEGMELDVLKGAKEVIQCSKPVIAVECFTKSIFNEINEYLKSFGYFVLDSHNATPTFIFINQYNSNHIKKMSEYLKFYSTEKFNNNSKFNK